MPFFSPFLHSRILNIQNPADAFLDAGRFQLSGLNLEEVRAVKISSSILLDFFNQPVVGLVFLDKSNLDLFAKVTQRLFSAIISPPAIDFYA